MRLGGIIRADIPAKTLGSGCLSNQTGSLGPVVAFAGPHPLAPYPIDQFVFKRNMPPDRRRRRANRLQVESLESRRLLATFVVNRTIDAISNDCDSDYCTLRDAVIAANATAGADTIMFDPSLAGERFDISSPIRITDSTSVVGLGHENLTLSGRGFSRLFILGDTGQQDYEIRDLTLANARTATGTGAAIQLDSASDTSPLDTLLLDNVIIRNTRAFGGGAVFARAATVTINASSFDSNSSIGQFTEFAGLGGAILLVDAEGSTITNSTISRSSATSAGAAISVVGEDSAASLSVTSTTFAENTATAIGVSAIGSNATVQLQATLVSSDSASSFNVGAVGDSVADIESLGLNLVHDSAGGQLDHETDRTFTAAQLGPRDDATFTYAPLPGSPAIDTGSPSGGALLATDQLGQSRARGDGIDVGAIEVAYDFGDAPTAAISGFDNSYPTLAADNGAYHNAIGPRLGALRESERDGVPTGDSLGDGDEDGVAFIGGRFQEIADALVLAIDLQNADSGANRLDAWVDWNRNGLWTDEGEQFAASLDLGTVDGTTVIDVPIPDDFSPGAAHFRFRLSTAGGLSPEGRGEDGEVEDYTIIFTPDDLVLRVDNAVDESDGDLTPGDLSLREAIEYANNMPGTDTIEIASELAGEVIDLTLGSLNVTDSVQILGPTDLPLEIDAGWRSRILDVVGANVDLAITDMVLRGGQSDVGQSGGAIRFDSTGDLSVERTAFTENRASVDGGAIASEGGNLTLSKVRVTENEAARDGGGIAANGGSLAMIDSTVSDNEAGRHGGGIVSAASDLEIVHSTVARNNAVENAGGVSIAGSFLSDASASLFGTTISSNEAGQVGGGLLHIGGQLRIDASTITENTAGSRGGGIAAQALPDTRTIVRSSIIAHNMNDDIDTVISRNHENQIISEGFNLIGDGDAVPLAHIGDVSAAGDPKLGPLGFYGGSNEVHPPMQNSLAIDGGGPIVAIDAHDLDADQDSSELVSIDARGVRRTIDLDGIDNASDGTDIGAVEAIGLSIEDSTAEEPDLSIPFALTLTDPIPDDAPVGATASTISGLAFRDADFVHLLDLEFDLPGDSLTMDFSVDLIDDGLIEPDESFGLRIDAPPGVVVVPEVATGTIISDDVAGLVLSTSAVTVSESGLTHSLEIALAAQPIAPVTIELSLDRDDEAQLDHPSLTFTSENWNIAQAVVISAHNDSRIDGDQTTQLTLAVSSAGDSNFDQLDNQQISVTTTDNDVAGVAILPIGRLETTEAGRMATFRVRLEALPESDVTIHLESSNTNEATVDRTTLVFTPENGTDNQLVTVTGIDDAEIDGNVELSIVIDAAISEDTNFSGLNPADVLVLNLDDERLDYGDAMDNTYPSLLASDGASHGASNLFLGTSIDFESDAIVSQNADGDASDNGVRPITTLVTSSQSDSVSSLIVHASAPGQLDAWFDLNDDGDWSDPGEQVVESVPLFAGDNLVRLTIPAGTEAGDVTSRFRLSSRGGLMPTGQAADGEVEDYRFNLQSADAPGTIDVRPPSGNANVDLVDGQIVVTSSGHEILRAAIAESSIISIDGNESDNLVVVGDITDAAIHVDHDGGDGFDIIRFESSDSARVQWSEIVGNLRNVEQIDASPIGALAIELDADEVLAVTDANNTLDVRLEEDDRLVLDNGWNIVDTETVDGNLYQIAVNGDATLRVSSGNGWTNPFNRLDVNGSGSVTTLDALILVNELTRGTYLEQGNRLVDVNSLDEFPWVLPRRERRRSADAARYPDRDQCIDDDQCECGIIRRFQLFMVGRRRRGDVVQIILRGIPSHPSTLHNVGAKTTRGYRTDAFRIRAHPCDRHATRPVRRSFLTQPALAQFRLRDRLHRHR